MRLAACLLALSVAAHGTASADAVADAQAARRVEEALGSLSSLRAEFRQVVNDAEGRLIERAEGTMALSRPDRFRWDYRDPPQLIVSDGAAVWYYDAELEQATVRDAKETLAGTPATVLAAGSGLEESFEISDAGAQDGLRWSLLRPRRADGDFRELRLGFADGTLRRMTLLDRLGQTTRLDFLRVERNPRLDAALFRFDPPPGVDVVGRASGR